MKKHTNLILASIVALLIFAVTFYLSPVMAISSMKSAIIKGDKEKIANSIDFPMLREDVRGQMINLMNKKYDSDPELAANPFAGLGKMMIPSLVSNLLDQTINADAISNFSQNQDETSEDGEKVETTPPKASEEVKAEKLGKVKTNMKWHSLERVDIIINIPGQEDYLIKSIKLKRNGIIGWKVIGANLGDKLSD